MLSQAPLLGNAILAGLPKGEMNRLLPHLEHVSLEWNDFLYAEGQTINYSYFPLKAMISVIITLVDGSVVETTLIGSEGMLGVRSLLGGKDSDSAATVQVMGDCLRVRSDILINEFDRDGELQRRLLHYTRYTIAQISQNAACNRVHLLEQRLCRWLLMLYRCVQHNEFDITHEVISQRLGTARSEVSIGARFLHNSGLIDYRRGKMRIIDPAGLESLACECYRVVKREMDHLIADLSPSSSPMEPVRVPVYSGAQGLIA